MWTVAGLLLVNPCAWAADHRNLEEENPIQVEDAFVIGYGLDYNHKHRELPFIAELAESHIPK